MESFGYQAAIAGVLGAAMIGWAKWEEARADRRGADEQSTSVKEFDERTK